MCSHLSEKGSNGRVFSVSEKLENHTNEGKGKEKTKTRGGRKEEKRKKQWLHSYFLQWLLWRFLTEKNCLFTFPSVILVFFLTIFFFVRRSTVEKHVEQAGEDEAGSCHPLDLKKLELDLVSLQEITK